MTNEHPMPASPLPWRVERRTSRREHVQEGKDATGRTLWWGSDHDHEGFMFDDTDASYILWACNNAPSLAAEVARLRAALEEIAESSTSDEHGAWMRAEGHAEEDDSDESCAEWMEVHNRIVRSARAALGAK